MYARKIRLCRMLSIVQYQFYAVRKDTQEKNKKRRSLPKKDSAMVLCAIFAFQCCYSRHISSILFFLKPFLGDDKKAFSEFRSGLHRNRRPLRIENDRVFVLFAVMRKRYELNFSVHEP